MSDNSGEGPPSAPLSACGVPDDAETTPWLFRGKDLSNDLAENLDNVDWEALEFRSWGIFPLGHPVRTWCHAVERSSGFKALVVAGVILSVVAVMAELDATEGSWINEPVAGSGGGVWTWSLLIELLCTAVFLFEFFVKTVDYGLVTNAKAYLRSSWGVLESYVLLVSVLSVAVKLSSSAEEAPVFFQFLVACKVLRIFKVIEVFSGLRLLALSFWRASKFMFRVGILFALALTIFGVIGLQLFVGAYRNRCVRYGAVPPEYHGLGPAAYSGDDLVDDLARLHGHGPSRHESALPAP